MSVEMHPIGYVRHDSEDVPRIYTISDVEGILVIDLKYAAGLSDIEVGQSWSGPVAFGFCRRK